MCTKVLEKAKSVQFFLTIDIQPLYSNFFFSGESSLPIAEHFCNHPKQ